MSLKLRLYFYVPLSILLFAGFLTACTPMHEPAEPVSAEYRITKDSLPLEITNWQVVGSFTAEQDSLLGDSLFRGWSDTLQMVNSDTTQHYWYCGVYHPKYNQLDLREVFDIAANDTTKALEGLYTYMSCTLKAESDMDVFLEVKKGMKCYQFLNGDTLHRIEVQGLNMYPVHLKAGKNSYVVKALGRGDDYSFEAAVYDSVGMARLYAEGQSGNIVYTEILNNVIMITNAHQRVTRNSVKLQFHDVYGNLTNETILKPDSFVYSVPELKPDVSYVCSMIMDGDTVRQAVLNGKIDDVVSRLACMRDSLPCNHPRQKEIDQVFYRLNFLLNHPTRHDGDWWWQFKIGALTYQLEHTFAHIDETYGQDKNEYNVKFITYKSKLDNGTQRYVLVTPNRMTQGKSYPLVVVVRPNIENHHHLFSCPQIARQWAVNVMQSLANQYGYVVMMPEARMYLDEELIPFAESELLLAMDDVKKHYNIDEDRIYLHANCSGGYRALQMAAKHPDLFAAVGLYAPLYERGMESVWSKANAPKSLMDNLKGMPMMIYGDPVDPHSPCSFYKELVEDCDRYDIPLMFELKRNAGLSYNIVVLGKEACAFFRDKLLNGRKSVEVKIPNAEKVMADFYAKPFMYVYSAADTTRAYHAMVDSIRSEYENYLFSALPLVPDTIVTKKMLAEKNVCFIGDKFSNVILDDYMEYIRGHQISKRDLIAVYQHPRNKNGFIMEYNTNLPIRFRHLYPWRRYVKRLVATKMNK